MVDSKENKPDSDSLSDAKCPSFGTSFSPNNGIKSIEWTEESPSGLVLFNSEMIIEFSNKIETSLLFSLLKLTIGCPPQVIPLENLTTDPVSQTLRIRSKELLTPSTEYTLWLDASTLGQRILSQSVGRFFVTRPREVVLGPNYLAQLHGSEEACCAIGGNFGALGAFVMVRDHHLIYFTNTKETFSEVLSLGSLEGENPKKLFLTSVDNNSSLDVISLSEQLFVETSLPVQEEVEKTSTISEKNSENPIKVLEEVPPRYSVKIRSYLNQTNVGTVVFSDSFLSTSVGSFRPSSIEVIADLNQDGNGDLVVADAQRGQIAIFGGTGSLFTQPRFYQWGASPTASDMVVADFNQDQFQDIALLLSQNNTILLLSGSKTGSLSERSRVVIPLDQVGGQLNRMVAVDINQDHFSDLVLTVSPSDLNQLGSAILLINDGTGRFLIPQSLPHFEVGHDPQGIAVGHFNLDPYWDIAVINKKDEDLSILMGNSAFQFEGGRRIATMAGAIDLFASSLKNTAYDDLLVSGSGPEISIILNDQNGRFFHQQMAAGQSPSDFVMTDFNNDQIADILVSDQTGNQVLVFSGNGASGYHRDYSALLPEKSGPIAIMAGHFTDVTSLGAATLNSGTQSLSWMNLEEGHLAVVGTVGIGAVPYQGITQDFNRDGQDDILALFPDSNQIKVILSTEGGFSNGEQVVSATREKPVWMAVGFFNSDRNLDVGLVHQKDHSLSILMGDGTGRFTEAQYLPFAQFLGDSGSAEGSTSTQNGSNAQSSSDSSGPPYAYKIFPINSSDTEVSKGLVVIKADGNSTRNAVVFLNQKGIFVMDHILNLFSHPTYVATADLNGDHVSELMVSNSQQVSVYHDNGSLFFDFSSASISLSEGLTKIAISDINGDQQPDVIVLNSRTGTITFLTQK